MYERGLRIRMQRMGMGGTKTAKGRFRKGLTLSDSTKGTTKCRKNLTPGKLPHRWSSHFWGKGTSFFGIGGVRASLLSSQP